MTRATVLPIVVFPLRILISHPLVLSPVCWSSPVLAAPCATANVAKQRWRSASCRPLTGIRLWRGRLTLLPHRQGKIFHLDIALESTVLDHWSAAALPAFGRRASKSRFAPADID